MSKAFSEHEKELIQIRLLEQGYRLFSTYGLRKTNIDELSSAAGISKGAFYRFYESKEALFMDVIEEVEKRVRQELLALIDLPGSSPRARLFAILKQSFSLFRDIPILHFFTGSDYDLLFRRIPAKKLQEHLINDLAFFNELVARCQDSGIPIRARTDQIVNLLYPVVIASLHEDVMGLKAFVGDIDLLLELVAAFCLGEIESQIQPLPGPINNLKEGKPK